MGPLSRLDNLLKSLAVEYDFDGIYRELILNEWIPDKLIEYGYVLVSGPNEIPCFWWENTRPTTRR